MKKNNQGFMLVETLICATFVSTILIVIYIQFQNINNEYEKSFKYNTVNDLYLANEAKKYIVKSDIIEKLNSNSNLIDITNLLENDSSEYSNLLNYGKTLLKTLNLKQVIRADKSITDEDYPSNITDEFKQFIKNNLPTDQTKNFYFEFNDGSYSYLKGN